MSRRRGHDNTGRSTLNGAERLARKLNAPPSNAAWVWVTREMVESPARRALSCSARKVIDRITLEHMAHGGGMNGQLAVTYADFRRYGIRGSSIYPAIEEAIALGFISRVDPGRKAWGEFKGSSAHYRIEWLPDCDGSPASNHWKRFQTLALALTGATSPAERALKTGVSTMSFSVFLAAPVHIEALESRLRKFGAEMHLPTDAELNECSSFDEYYRVLDSRAFQVDDRWGVARIDPKGFIFEVGHRCVWLARAAAEEFGTYVVHEQEYYGQEGYGPPLEEDEDRDRWWQLQASWEKQAREARVRQFVADVRRLHAGLLIDAAPESFLGKLTQAAASAAGKNAELLSGGSEELLLARAQEALNPNPSEDPLLAMTARTGIPADVSRKERQGAPARDRVAAECTAGAPPPGSQITIIGHKGHLRFSRRCEITV